MAIYRNVQLGFWTDPKVEDDFTPEDKYFYLFLFTNPQTNMCGCYEISIKTMVDQTGYSSDTIQRLLDRFQNVHKVIEYSKETKEIYLKNWYKYNWQGGNQIICIDKEIEHVKNLDFKRKLREVFDYKFNKKEGACKGLDSPLQATVTVINNNINNINKNINKKDSKKSKYGEYKNVLLSDEQYKKLVEEFPKDYEKWIDKVSTYCEANGKTYKNYLAVIRNWSKNDNSKNKKTNNKFIPENQNDYDFDNYEKSILSN